MRGHHHEQPFLRNGRFLAPKALTTDIIAKASPSGDFGATPAGYVEPDPHIGDERSKPFLPSSKTSLRIKATQFGFDPVQLSDALNTFLGNWCCCVAGDLYQLATSVCPTVGKPNAWINALWCD